jgi:imidazolonepropionase-like amidohydrolase
MGLLNRLGLRRPDPPRCFAEGPFHIAGATVINPMHDRRAGATLDISSGAVAGISDTPAVPPSEFAGCFALPGLVDMHVHLPPNNALAARRQSGMSKVPPFYLDVIWHPERGQFNNRLPRDYLERQVVPAIAKKQRLTRRLFDAGAQLYLGTDVAQPFVIPGASLLEEMALFVEAGIGV